MPCGTTPLGDEIRQRSDVTTATLARPCEVSGYHGGTDRSDLRTDPSDVTGSHGSWSVSARVPNGRR